MAERDATVSGSPSGGDDPEDSFFPGLLVLWDELTFNEVAAFRTALETARDEGDMQRLLEAHPRLLIQHLTTGRRSWVIPKKRLGSEHETDFVIAQKASDGYVWCAVELERPQVKMFNKNGDPSAALTHALRQIDDWRDWLSRNLDYAQRPRDRSGLGLIDIHPELDGMVIIGRDVDLDRRAIAPRRQRLERTHRVKIETYDWLLAQATDRLTTMEKKARDIISQNPLFGLLDAAARNPRVPSAAERVVIEAFDGLATGWTGRTAVRDSIEWEAVEIWPDPDEIDHNVVAALKIVYAKRMPTDKRLQPGDWQQWVDYVTRALDAEYSLLVTEIVPDETLLEGLTFDSEGVWYATEWHPWYGGSQLLSSFHVLVCLPPVPGSHEKVEFTYADKRSRIDAARELFRRFVPDPVLEQEQDAAREREVLLLAPGDYVVHVSFGPGTVVSTSGYGNQAEARIDFGAKHGIKHLVLRYAPLEEL